MDKPESSAVAPGKKALFAVAAGLLSLSLLALFGEGLCRFALGDRLPPPLHEDERSLAYRYDATLGWFPREGSEAVIERPRRIRVRHNSRGFRDSEHGPRGDRPRMVVLGDSFVWGYEVEDGERFTDRLAGMMPGWEVLNLGVSGYGTDQEYLLLQGEFEHYEPDLVFLLVFSNDFDDNRTNKRYFGYYKPYFEASFSSGSMDLDLRGVPVPRSVNYFYARHARLFRWSYLARALGRVYDAYVLPREIILDEDPTLPLVAAVRDYVEGRGAMFVLGIADGQSAELIAPAGMMGIRHVYLENPYRFETDGRHWTPEGHAVAAERIFAYLAESGFFASAGRERPGVP